LRTCAARGAPGRSMLTSRWVTLTSRWVTLTSRWVTLTSRWVTLASRWVGGCLASSPQGWGRHAMVHGGEIAFFGTSKAVCGACTATERPAPPSVRLAGTLHRRREPLHTRGGRVGGPLCADCVGCCVTVTVPPPPPPPRACAPSPGRPRSASPCRPAWWPPPPQPPPRPPGTDHVRFCRDRVCTSTLVRKGYGSS
jgi:hypothetical protein